MLCSPDQLCYNKANKAPENEKTGRRADKGAGSMKRFAALMLVVMLALCAFAQAEGTAPELEPNTLYVEIEGEPRVFYLTSAKLVNTLIAVTYSAYDARGDLEMTFVMNLDKRIAPGTYQKAGSGEDVNSIILNADAVGGLTNYHYRERYGVGAAPFKKSEHGGVDFSFFVEYHYNDEGSVVMRIDSRSSDWTTYDGVFAAVMDDAFDGDFITLRNGRFNFTLDEAYVFPEDDEDAPPKVTLDDLPF